MDWNSVQELLRQIGSLTDDAPLTRGVLFVVGSLGAVWIAARRVFSRGGTDRPADRVKIDAPDHVDIRVRPKERKHLT